MRVFGGIVSVSFWSLLGAISPLDIPVGFRGILISVGFRGYIQGGGELLTENIRMMLGGLSLAAGCSPASIAEIA